MKVFYFIMEKETPTYMKSEYMKILKNVVNNYEEYKEIAVPLKWIDSVSNYYYTSRNETHMHLYTIEFPTGYLKNNFGDAFVQAVLTVMAYTEEFEQNFWKEISIEERKVILNKASRFYGEYICFDRLEMKEMTYGELVQEVFSWFPRADIEKGPNISKEVKKVLDMFSGADAVWIGGMDQLDENWIAVYADTILLINFCCSG